METPHHKFEDNWKDVDDADLLQYYTTPFSMFSTLSYIIFLAMTFLGCGLMRKIRGDKEKS
jgi:hypothetical protein